MSNKHYCYIISNEFGKTYNGYTVNLKRRLRQHNKELVGGAKRTKVGNWRFIAILSGFYDNHEALSCEWKIAHPTNTKIRPKKYCSEKGRIESLNLVLCLDCWTSKSLGLKSGLKYVLFVDYKMIGLLDINVIKPNVEIRDLNEILIEKGIVTNNDVKNNNLMVENDDDNNVKNNNLMVENDDNNNVKNNNLMVENDDNNFKNNNLTVKNDDNNNVKNNNLMVENDNNNVKNNNLMVENDDNNVKNNNLMVENDDNYNVKNNNNSMIENDDVKYNN